MEVLQSDLPPPEPLEEPGASLRCSICVGLLCDPVIPCVKGHVFCRDCINRWDQMSSKCPECRSYLLSKPWPFALFQHQQLSALKVRCVYSSLPPEEENSENNQPEEADENSSCAKRMCLQGMEGAIHSKVEKLVMKEMDHESTTESDDANSNNDYDVIAGQEGSIALNGCKWIGRWEQMQAHLKHCTLAFVFCSWKGCRFSYDETMQREKLNGNLGNKHLRLTSNMGLRRRGLLAHTRTCYFQPFPCFQCGDPTLPIELANHMDTCRCTVIFCPYANQGCRARLPRQTMALHAVDCEKKMVISQTSMENEGPIIDKLCEAYSSVASVSDMEEVNAALRRVPSTDGYTSMAIRLERAWFTNVNPIFGLEHLSVPIGPFIFRFTLSIGVGNVDLRFLSVVASDDTVNVSQLCLESQCTPLMLAGTQYRPCMVRSATFRCADGSSANELVIGGREALGVGLGTESHLVILARFRLIPPPLQL